MVKKILVTEAQLSAMLEFLVEDRGMFANYNGIAKAIIEYVQNYLKVKNFDTEDVISDNITAKVYNITIPENLLSQIQWADNKVMIINVFDITTEQLNSLGGIAWAKKITTGSAYTSESDALNQDKKLTELDIEISLISTNKTLIANYFGNVLYHELTHAYQNYNQLLKIGVGLHQHNKNTNYAEIMNNLQDPTSDENLHMFNIINYSLLNTAELNAIIAGVYGSLETLNSTRENFQRDIQRISGYGLYKNIKNTYLPKLISLDDSYWDIFMHAAYQQKRIPTKDDSSQLRKETPQKFKQRFLNSVNFKLKQLINGIGRVASKYYDDIEKQ